MLRSVRLFVHLSVSSSHANTSKAVHIKTMAIIERHVIGNPICSAGTAVRSIRQVVAPSKCPRQAAVGGGHAVYRYAMRYRPQQNKYVILTDPTRGVYPQTSDNTSRHLTPILTASSRVHHPYSSLIIGLLYVFSISVHVLAIKYKQMMHRNQFLQAQYYIDGFAPRSPPGLSLWTLLGHFGPPDPLLPRYTPDTTFYIKS